MARPSQSTPRPEQLFVGVDIGKAHHWVCAVNQDGSTLLSRKVLNNETDIRNIIAAINEMGVPAKWAVDIIGALSALLLALLAESDQTVR